jgi:K+-sensing histidine kinase KdpD
MIGRPHRPRHRAAPARPPQDEEQALARLLAALNRAATLEEVAETSAAATRDALRCEAAGLAAVPPDGAPRFIAVAGAAPADAERLPLDPLVTQAAREGRLVTQVGPADPAPHHRAAVAAPCRAGGRVVAVLFAARDRPFDPRDERLLQLLADAAGMAVARAELLDRELRSAWRLHALQLITDAALTHLRLDDLLDELFRRMDDIMGVDAAAILLLDADGRTLVSRASHGTGTTGDRQLRIPVGEGVLGRIAAERRAAMVEDVPRGDPAAPFLRAAGVRSLLGVPLLVEGRVTGVLYVGTARPRRFTEEDARLLGLVADRAALAVDHARLYEAEQAARAAAEDAQRRLAFLAEASAVLASSLDYEATLASVARLAVPFLADWCVVDLVDDDGTIRRVAQAHCDPEKERLAHELHRRYPLHPDTATIVGRVLRSGQAELVPAINPERLAEVAQDAQHLDLLRRIGPRSVLCVPLVVRGRTIGAIALRRTESVVPFTEADRELAEGLARRASLAVDNAHLYREARETVQREQAHALRLARLAVAFVEVNRAVTLTEALQVTTEQARLIIGAHQAITSLTVGKRGEQAVRAVSFSEKYAAWRAYEAVPDDSYIDALVCRENRPLRLTQAELEAHPAWQGAGVEATRHPPLRGWLAAPLIGRGGENLGLIQLSDKEAGDFTAEDEAILVQLAQLASAVIEKLRLQEQAAAAAAAVEADRLKTDLLNTVSHELRTPLAAIKGFTTTILMYPDRLDPEEQLSFLREIDTACDRLSELVDNLLQLARLESGVLRIDRRPAALPPLLRNAVADARRRHPDRVIELEVDGEIPRVSVDARRIVQVVANLIDNAVKFSPDGGEVVVRLGRAATGEATIAVVDHGIGIAPEHLPRVFERFYRVDSGRARDIGGSGLGLAICRGIVEAQGGRIEAASVPGVGSTFTVVLPPIG